VADEVCDQAERRRRVRRSGIPGDEGMGLALEYHQQPDKALHHICILCELAQVRDYLRDGFITPRSRPETQMLCCASVR
jgi:hypothetical protein